VEKIEQLINTLRPGQQRLGTWQEGRMAVAAVPGAGKSHSLAVAAALTIARHQLNSSKQLIIVTYTRSAAASIKSKIRHHLKQMSLAGNSFVVYTLHGLALNIATRHPELSQINLEQVTVIVPNTAHQIIRDTTEKWISQNQAKYKVLLEGKELDAEESEILRRSSVLRTEVLPNLALTVIREAKSSGLSPEDLWDLANQNHDHYQILALAAGLYQQYQQLMKEHNYIDYDEMILAALKVLENPVIAQKWQNQVFAVFEDEAQDSSPLQERLISLLAKNPHHSTGATNLIRVGDPNQAINSTFTTADPMYFNWFCSTCEAENALSTMDQAGRSSRIIIDAANFVVSWVNYTWGKKPVAPPFRFQQIKPVSLNDPQPEANPAPEGKGLEIYTPDNIYETVDLIGKRVLELLTQNPNHSAAILVRENRQGSFLGDKLNYLQHQHKIRVYEVGDKERQSKIPLEMLKLLQFLDRPHSPDCLKAALEILEGRDLIPAQDLNALAIAPEQFLYPTVLEPPQKAQIKEAQRYCRNLLKARLELPTYELIAFLGLALKYTGSELATAQKLADKLNKHLKGKFEIKEIINALRELVTTEKFEEIEEETDNQYTREKQLTIITMHKAKGLDWDYVFIPFLHQDIIPGQLRVPTGAKFLADYTLGEVARAQIRAAMHGQYQGKKLSIPDPLTAWEEAQMLKEAEEYRLLYVAMTRAKRLLWMSAAKNGPYSWNTFTSGNDNFNKKQPCPVLAELIRQYPGNYF